MDTSIGATSLETNSKSTGSRQGKACTIFTRSKPARI